jgi:peptidoglycan hydrolase-like protein with peptidoglycan-binding domain
MDEAGEPSPWADRRAGHSHSRRRYASVVVLALLFGCGKATTRPAPAEHRPSEGSTSAIGPIDRDLMRVQRRLKDLGHDPGPIDGRLGLQTKGALKAFQTDYGLAPTGKIDAETRAALALGFGERPP